MEPEGVARAVYVPKPTLFPMSVLTPTHWHAALTPDALRPGKAPPEIRYWFTNDGPLGFGDAPYRAVIGRMILCASLQLFYVRRRRVAGRRGWGFNTMSCIV